MAIVLTRARFSIDMADAPEKMFRERAEWWGA
jgi:hypothetical protein